MFGRQFWPAGMWGAPYWPTGTAGTPAPPVVHPTEATGGGKVRRRRPRGVPEPYVRLEKPSPRPERGKPAAPEPVPVGTVGTVGAPTVEAAPAPAKAPRRRAPRLPVAPPAPPPGPSAEGLVLAALAPDAVALSAQVSDDRLRLLLFSVVSLS